MKSKRLARQDDEVAQFRRIKAAERELVALCNRHSVLLVYEQAQDSQGFNGGRFVFKCLPKGTDVTASSPPPPEKPAA